MALFNISMKRNETETVYVHTNISIIKTRAVVNYWCEFHITILDFISDSAISACFYVMPCICF